MIKLLEKMYLIRINDRSLLFFIVVVFIILSFIRNTLILLYKVINIIHIIHIYIFYAYLIDYLKIIFKQYLRTIYNK